MGVGLLEMVMTHLMMIIGESGKVQGFFKTLRKEEHKNKTKKTGDPPKHIGDGVHLFDDNDQEEE